MDNKEISQLAERFMDGQTTLAEEKRLAEALNQNDDPQWEPYRRMFTFITDGCPAKSKPRRTWTSFIQWIGVGATAAVLLGVFILRPLTNQPLTSPIAKDATGTTLYAGNNKPSPPPFTRTEQTAGNVQTNESGRERLNLHAEHITHTAYNRPNSSTRDNATHCGNDTRDTIPPADESGDFAEVDLARYIAMVVDSEPEIPSEAPIDEDELINRCIDATLCIMDMHMRTIENIATAMQKQDEVVLDKLTKTM